MNIFEEHDSIEMEHIQDTIRWVFSMEESKQADTWKFIIEVVDSQMSDVKPGSMAWDWATQARDIYISIAKEAKYFG